MVVYKKGATELLRRLQAPEPPTPAAAAALLQGTQAQDPRAAPTATATQARRWPQGADPQQAGLGSATPRAPGAASRR